MTSAAATFKSHFISVSVIQTVFRLTVQTVFRLTIQDKLCRVLSVTLISTALVRLLTHRLQADYWGELPQQPQDHMTDSVSSLHSPLCIPPSINCFILVGEQQQNAFQTSAPMCDQLGFLSWLVD